MSALNREVNIVADYMDSSILAQSYVHVEPGWLTELSSEEREERIAEIKKMIIIYASERMPFFLYKDVEVKVEITEGSIIAKATAYGSLVVMLNHAPSVIKDYPTYRQGVKAIVADVVRVADALNTEVLYYTNSRSKREIRSIEARKGIFGKLDRINNKINELDSMIKKKDSTPVVVFSKLLDVHKLILESLDEIKDNDDLIVVRKSIAGGVESLIFRASNFKIKSDADKLILENVKNEKRKILNNLL